MSIFGNVGGWLGDLLDQYGGPQAVLTQVFNQMGGVQGVLAKLQQAGLGGQVGSWLGTGPNQPVSPAEIGNALGHGPLANVASSLGMTPDQLSQALAHALPGIVDKLSPHGTLQPQMLNPAAPDLTGLAPNS